MNIADAVGIISRAIDKAKEDSPLAAVSVTLLGASKGQGTEVIETALREGITDFGENRVQEAQAKWPDIKKRWPDSRLHLIGPLQTNKAEDAVALFDVIQTIDRPKLAGA